MAILQDNNNDGNDDGIQYQNSCQELGNNNDEPQLANNSSSQQQQYIIVLRVKAPLSIHQDRFLVVPEQRRNDKIAIDNINNNNINNSKWRDNSNNDD